MAEVLGGTLGLQPWAQGERNKTITNLFGSQVSPKLFGLACLSLVPAVF